MLNYRGVNNQHIINVKVRFTKFDYAYIMKKLIQFIYKGNNQRIPF